MKRVKSFAVWFNLAWPNWFSNGSREELVSTDYLGRSIVSLVTVRQLSNAFRLSAYLVTLRMTRVLEFPRASSRNGIQTLRVIPRPSTSRKLIRTIRGYRAPILISSRSREKILESGYLRKGRPSIISPIGLAVSPRRQRRPFRLDRKLFHRFHSGERSSFSRIPSGKLPRIISNPSVSRRRREKMWRVARANGKKSREEESRYEFAKFGRAFDSSMRSNVSIRDGSERENETFPPRREEAILAY